MDEQTITLLEQSFAAFAAGKEDSAALFYERLFALDPSLKRLFVNSDMRSQHIKLMAALGLVIQNLRGLDLVVPKLQELAVRHVGYGVTTQHYDTVGTALIQTFALSLGNRFTPEARSAWVAAYGLVSGVMIAATEQALTGVAAE